MHEKKLKHLEFIQLVIKRLAINSFQLKGWCVTLVVGVLFFTSTVKDEKYWLTWISFLPIVSFWILDGYFLWQERIFRKTYDLVRTKTEAEIDFIMPVPSTGEKWAGAIFSKTLLVFYLSLVITLTLVILFLNTFTAL